MTSTEKLIEYRIVPEQSQVAFSVKHLMISRVKGCFERFGGVFRLIPADPARSEFEGVIEVASITTFDRARDDYLRTHEFFDPKRYPEMRFRSSRIELASAGRAKIQGALQIKDVSRTVELEAGGLEEVFRAGGSPPKSFEIQARGKIDRREFGLVWPPAIEAGGVLVGNEVEISIRATFRHP
jgi:polyisoprenoid-binding protein YceI